MLAADIIINSSRSITISTTLPPIGGRQPRDTFVTGL